MKFRFILLLALLSADMALANEVHDLLMGMTEEKRAYALARLLERSGERCPSVRRTFYQGSDNNGNAFWNADCVAGSSWVMQINNDSRGSMRIAKCSAIKAISGLACFTKLK